MNTGTIIITLASGRVCEYKVYYSDYRAFLNNLGDTIVNIDYIRGDEATGTVTFKSEAVESVEYIRDPTIEEPIEYIGR